MAKINLTKFRNALRDSMGSITIIAKSCGVERSTVYAFIEKHPKVKEDIDLEIGRIKELAEDNMKSMALTKNFKALKFFLERKCGWVPKQEIDVKSENKTIIDLAEDAELDDYIEKNESKTEESDADSKAQ